MPQDPTDEPASVLIEQIRLEKEQLIKDKKSKKIRTNYTYLEGIILIMRSSAQKETLYRR